MRCNAMFAALVLAAGLQAERFGLDTPARIVRLSDPQISPNGRQVALMVGRSNIDENRFDAELVLVDAASKAQRVLVRGRRGLSQPRWSPDGSRLGFLAQAPDAKPQVWVLPVDGGEAWQVTRSSSVQQFVWRPGGKEIAYVAFDEAPKMEGPERHNRSFEVQHNHFLLQEAARPAHVWLVNAEGGPARRLTSGGWSLPASLPPSAPSSPLSFTPDGKRLALVRLETPYTGDADRATIGILDVETGALRSLTGRARNETQPVFSPDAARRSLTGGRARAIPAM